MRRPPFRPIPLPAVGAVVVVVALLLAGVVSRFASTSPDGLERVADEHGLADQAQDHALADSPVAHYSLRGVEDDGLATGAAGVLGVVATLALGCGVATVLGKARRAAADPGPSTNVDAEPPVVGAAPSDR